MDSETAGGAFGADGKIRRIFGCRWVKDIPEHGQAEGYGLWKWKRGKVRNGVNPGRRKLGLGPEIRRNSFGKKKDTAGTAKV